MILTQDGINLMHKFEGLRLQAYLCPANVATIGYGNTFYENGTKVKIGDVISIERAEQLFSNITEDTFCKPLRPLIKSNINNNQFSALVCFAYNLGIGAISKSTLLKKVNLNPIDLSISQEFKKWNKAGGKVLLGLTRRRDAESKLYFLK